MLFAESFKFDDVVFDTRVGWFAIVEVGRNMAEGRPFSVEAGFAVA